MIVDLFAGPGGWDHAATQLGLGVVGIEHDHAACETRRAAGLATVEGDVRSYGPADFPEASDLLGSPPCQPYSVGGKGRGRAALDTVLGLAEQLARRESITRALAGFDDDRTGLVLEPLRWTLEAIDAGHPYNTVMLEQVPTVLPVWDAFARILRAEGYSVATGRLSAEEYGVPQTRLRTFLAASLSGKARLPAPTHHRYRNDITQEQEALWLRPWVSMASAIGWGMTARPALTIAVGTAAGGPDPSCVGGSGARATLYGERDAGRWINCARIVDADDLPAYRGGRRDTIRLSVQDAAILQSFPADYPWQGSWTKQLEQIGNAVPPLLAMHVVAATSGLDLPAHLRQEAAA
ncbi:DNA cytosine methyltransferase [Nonomuraea zeae]|uniref:DNA (cytosine-5-)-methyltransferase n=1 Tax=Nonomuraea zeae TaxID=1642303 RepID=A0A5S4H3D5_9ACTN|nr:DNA cytosine methyltransferase [Nonomuraea zeae]TMR39616.1 DNA cytosine methyltransferase [Nonomuraea zeae]